MDGVILDVGEDVFTDIIDYQVEINNAGIIGFPNSTYAEDRALWDVEIPNSNFKKPTGRAELYVQPLNMV